MVQVLALEVTIGGTDYRLPNSIDTASYRLLAAIMQKIANIVQTQLW